jgi:hypothetical protein
MVEMVFHLLLLDLLLPVLAVAVEIQTAYQAVTVKQEAVTVALAVQAGQTQPQILALAVVALTIALAVLAVLAS